MKKNRIFLAVRSIGGLKFAKYLTRKHPRILMYHRVSRSGDKGTISVDNFRAQMKLVRQFFNPLTLSQLMNYADNDVIPDNSVVITVDDGYSDFSEYIWPIMQEENVPATLFITTGFVNRELWLWPDKIRYAIENSKQNGIYLPEIGYTKISNNEFQAWDRISSYCLNLPNSTKHEFIGRLYKTLNVEYPSIVPKEFSALSWEELKDMISLGLEVGSHSHSHPILTKLSQGDLENEIFHSKSLLRDKLGIEVCSFCYPNGTRIDFNDEIKALVRAAGYKYAVAAYAGNRPLSDRWEIKRYAGGQSKSSFEKNLFGLTFLSTWVKGKLS